MNIRTFCKIKFIILSMKFEVRESKLDLSEIVPGIYKFTGIYKFPSTVA